MPAAAERLATSGRGPVQGRRPEVRGSSANALTMMGLLAGTLLLPVSSFSFIPRVPFQELPDLRQRGVVTRAAYQDASSSPRTAHETVADAAPIPDGARRIPAGSESEDRRPSCS